MATPKKSKLSGHAAHTQNAATAGLPGTMQRPIKLTMLGAGSGFTPRLVNDVLRIPGNQGGVIALVEIGAARLRTVPVFLEVLRDCENLCPQALVLNYTNPMAMMCTAAGRASSMAVVGLCHSVQGTSHLLADYAGIPCAEMAWECAGINHLAWFTKLEHQGVNLYTDRLYQKFTADLAAAEAEGRAGTTSFDSADVKDWGKTKPRTYQHIDLVRKDMCLNFGAFITESSGHLSEYLPYYRKSEAGRALLRQGYDGGSRFYATNWPDWRKAADASRAAMLKGTESIDW